MAEAGPEPIPERLFWTRSFSLTARILAVNIIALGLLAGSLFYLDSYRNQLLAERFNLARAEAEIAADGLVGSSRSKRRKLLAVMGPRQVLRLRLYDAKGNLAADSFKLADPAFTLVEPDAEHWYEAAARALDRTVDWIVGTPAIEPYSDPESPKADVWPEIAESREAKATVVRQRLAPDRTPIITAATPVGTKGEMLLTTRNAADITQHVRDARRTLGIVVGAALVVSTLLSLFLARTIIAPLRALMRATIRVRLGRERDVEVPRLPERRDEIGLLARAVSDMTSALRQRIDAVDAFAADVAHEIKNPLASLRSAVETLERIEDPELQKQLTAIAAHDVRRIDRLVTEIAEASRIDAELSRTTFAPVDMFALVQALVAERTSRGVNGSSELVVRRRGNRDCYVAGEAARLERVIENLLDNAVSFSPQGQPIELELAGSAERVTIAVNDHGPGIPADAREKVFERFHSLRPAGEDFGGHSGLGLAIARTIVEAHGGTLAARDRADRASGARMVVTLPAWQTR